MSRMSFYAYITFIFAVFFMTVTAPAKAQNTTPGPGIPQAGACNQVARSCTQVIDLDPTVNGPHRIQLKQSGLPGKTASGELTQFYITCGLETDEGFLMTTGNPTYDQRLCLGADSYAKLQSKVGYQLNLMGNQNPFTAENGSIDVTIMPSNQGDPRHHMCMIMWELPATTTGNDASDPSSNSASETSYGLEYTSFTFASSVDSCKTVYVDPYGRTYNKSLKPVPAARVSIFDYDLKSLLNLPGVPNPVTTEETGIFNFNIPPGRSYLQTNLTNTPLDVHPNYKLAYTEPYVYGDLIVEALGKAEQRDIPVSGGAEPVLKLMAYSHLRLGNTIHIQGIASWPLTMVDVMQGTTSVAQQQADKFGNFTFAIDPARIDPTQQITVRLTEVDLTVNPKAPAADPATDSITFDPIPAYLEGYAYDANGKRVPFATVRIRITATDDIYYQTKANQDAYYAIAPRHIPMFPYYLEIIPANTLPGSTGTAGGTGGSTISGAPQPTDGSSNDNTGTAAVSGAASRITIPVYARQNKEYHDTQVVDIMAGTKNGTKVDPTAVASGEDAVFGSAKAQSANPFMKKGSESGEANAEETRQNYIMLLIMVTALIFVGSGTVIFIRKRAHGQLHDSSGDLYTKNTDIKTPTGE